MSTNSDAARVEGIRYHLLARGELPPSWTGFLDTHVLGATTGEGYTVLDVRVPDQAALLALLARVHALHLPLQLLVRLDA